MISHRTEIALKDLQDKLPSYPVFTTVDKTHIKYSVTSKGHNLSSQNILKFVEKGILSYDDIDVIHSDYMVNGAVDYWCNILSNNTFDLNRICSWITDTKLSTVVTFARDNSKKDGYKNNVILWETIKEVYTEVENLESFRVLPFIAHNQTPEKSDYKWLYLNQAPKTYISDAYRSQKGTDAQLKKYDPKDAFLVDDRYLQGNTSVDNINSSFAS